MSHKIYTGSSSLSDFSMCFQYEQMDSGLRATDRRETNDKFLKIGPELSKSVAAAKHTVR